DFVTRRLLEESGFSRTRPETIARGFADIVDPELVNAEPNGPIPRSVLEDLRTGLARVTSEQQSAMLYGPPGTSKTTLAEAVAKSLGWWLVQLSPADFLIEGPNAIEYRAKRIFDYLLEMNRVVVLFDEIDHLVLDRSSKLYASQDNVFQFMTPSMLPKLKALHDQPGVRF